MSDYKDTLNLPKTNFEMRANLVKHEPEILEYWYKNKLYQKIRESKLGKKMFILHDGPPYANGNIHIGHSVNKILKDIIIKSKGLNGYDSPYIPGWDCHGLPIEHKIEQYLKKNKKHISDTEFRIKCREYAQFQIEKQKKDFIRLGVLGDWNKPYYTMNFKVEADTIRVLGKIIKNNNLVKKFKPVYWCTECKSSLAEAEVEYHKNISPAIYVRFEALNSDEICKKFGFICNKSISIIIWTTTPWTLPANRAISINPKAQYSLIDVDNELIILASDLVIDLMKTIGKKNWTIHGICNGNELELFYFKHPFMNFNVPIILSNHVVLNVGTGAVHTAPDHGQEDYIVASKYKLKLANLIDSNGCFLFNIHPLLNGIFIFKSNDIIIKILNEKQCLFYKNYITHKVPFCWRHKTLVIFRATKQWFICMNKNNLRKQLLNEINYVKWIPSTGFLQIKSMLENRPDWCISRQRIWGTPITLFVHKKTGKLHPRTLELIEDIANKVENNGIQAWWDLNIKDILGNEANSYEKIQDTLDVWFDSGSTYFTVIDNRLEYHGNSVDLYLEGLDQHRGWFMSSLILSVITKKKHPYNQVLTHGFVVDGQNRKMSKSIGNTISPKDIINKFGADILRLWVACSNYNNDIAISDEILKGVIDSYRHIRNTARFLLANLNDFNPEINIVKPKNMISIDYWAVGQAFKTQKKIIKSYNKYDFFSVIKHITHFCSIKMSSFYLDIIKDRKYTTKSNSLNCYSCQSALFHIIESLVRWISPILSFTSDEIWKKLPGKRSKFVFTEEWYDGLFCLNNSIEMNDNFWKKILIIKTEVNKILEQARRNKYIKSSLETSLILYADNDIFKKLNMLRDELHFVFMTSQIKILNINESPNDAKNSGLNGLKIICNKAEGKKCNRCWHYTKDISINLQQKDICNRCISNIFGDGEVRKFV
ncbi:isoleucine--tRNA ligase [Candidatus Providencia siddallii]|uniref:Isoleucine--tRNA ligase n=1 Tax=Candidatus Providencia siddallii TaxID=1715285 RepID=A0ABM9NP45_9GAMM